MIKKDFTRKQTKYIAARIAGSTCAEAKRRAGYVKNVAQSTIESPAVMMKLKEAMVYAGINTMKIANELKRGIKVSWNEGKQRILPNGEVKNCPDFTAHARYLDIACQTIEPEARNQQYPVFNFNQKNYNMSEDSLLKMQEMFQRAIEEKMSSNPRQNHDSTGA